MIFPSAHRWPLTRYLIGLSLLLLIACQSDEPDPQLEEAFAVHQVAVQTHDSLQQELNALSAQSLSREQQQTYSRLQEASELWESHVMEVPGYEHAEGHDHDHDHQHGAELAALKDLPPAEMLRIQQALVHEVQRLLDETRQLAKEAANPAPQPQQK